MPSRLNVDTETLTERYGKFHAAPFERGFGTTVGNSIRRALLSSIEGAAITAVKIEGVEHEFSSIKGVVEDATDIILNLKQVPITLHGSGPKTLSITKKGAGIVTSGDIVADGDVEILDKEVHIATISAGGSGGFARMHLNRGLNRPRAVTEGWVGAPPAPAPSAHSHTHGLAAGNLEEQNHADL